MTTRSGGTYAGLFLALLIAGCGGSGEGGGGSGGNNAPTANAGADQSVDDGATVNLDGSGSSDSDGDSLTYTWTQTAGPDVTLSDGSAESPSFTAPTVPGGTSLTFELDVSDGEESATDTVIVTVVDVTPPGSNVADDQLTVTEPLVILFDESMDTDSLSYNEGIAQLVGTATWSDTNVPNDTLTLAPAEAWESGWQDMNITVADTAGNSLNTVTGLAIRLELSNFQTAEVVIGQADFAGVDANQGGTADANTLNAPYGIISVYEGRVWIPDYSNDRVLGFDGVPSANNASATWVVGQPDFTTTGGGTSATKFDGPQTALEHDGRFYMLEYNNNRVTVFDSIPLTPPATASHAIGQPDLTNSVAACTASGFDSPEVMVIADGKLVVADSSNHRVLIWNSVPTDADAVPADIVLGQNSMTNCGENDDDQNGASDIAPSARTLSYPSGVWTDGHRLVVADTNNNRVLIWQSFPESNFQPADIVLGQEDFANNTANDDDQDGGSDTATARTLNGPYESVWSNAVQLFVGDSNNNRVLVWNTFPTTSFEPADVVLGQSDFSFNAINDDDQDGSSDAAATARTLNYPVGGGIYRNKLLVMDLSNNRVLVYTGQ